MWPRRRGSQKTKAIEAPGRAETPGRAGAPVWAGPAGQAKARQAESRPAEAPRRPGLLAGPGSGQAGHHSGPSELLAQTDVEPLCVTANALRVPRFDFQ